MDDKWARKSPHAQALHTNLLQAEPGNNASVCGQVVFLFLFHGSQVNTNGILSFQSAFTFATIRMFPLLANISLIAPFWGDVDITRFGNIFYRETSNTTLLQRAQDQLQGLFLSSGNFTPTTLFIATWDRVAEFVPFFSVGEPQVHAFADMIVGLLMLQCAMVLQASPVNAEHLYT